MVHRGPFLQRGTGIGSFFRSLFRSIIPLAKSGLSTLVKGGVQAVKSNTGKKLANIVKTEVKKGGIKAIGNLLAGENVMEGMREDLDHARERIGKTLVNSVHPASVEGSTGRKRRTASHLKPRRKKKKKAVADEEW
jgi:uncharacterized Ntn-hydrolase superfamily protein